MFSFLSVTKTVFTSSGNYIPALTLRFETIISMTIEPYPMALGIFWSSYVSVYSSCVTVCSYVLSRVKDLGSSLVE